MLQTLLRDFRQSRDQTEFSLNACRIYFKGLGKEELSDFFLHNHDDNCAVKNTCQKHLFRCKSSAQREMKTKVSLNSKDFML